MHHPEIYEILSIIEDYFIFTDTKFRCQIEPVICEENYHTNDPNASWKGCRKGFRIIRQLKHGRIEINVLGTHKDSDCADFYYFTEEEPSQPAQVIEATNTGYSTEAIRDTIRQIVILDRERGIKSQPI